MRSIEIDEIRSAERIALPKGENNETYRRYFSEYTGIEIPMPPSGKLSARAGGQEFFWLRGIDIPGITDKGLVDVGLTGTDAFLDYEGYDNLRNETIGTEVCRLSVLTPPDKFESFRKSMSVERRYIVPMICLPTTRPRALERASCRMYYPFRACKFDISGSVEAYPELIGTNAVADLVKTGKTARANGLEEAWYIFGVFAEAIMQKDGRKQVVQAISPVPRRG
jgi:ATP phosphoribosyltransferase